MRIKIQNGIVQIGSLVQSFHNETGVAFTSDQDAWIWVVSSGWWDRLMNEKLDELVRDAELARRRALLSVVGTDNPEQLRAYDQKYSEALSWTTNNASPTPTLSAEATQTGETVASLAPMVIIEYEDAKAALTSQYGRIDGIRRNAKSSIISINPTGPEAAASLEAVIWRF